MIFLSKYLLFCTDLFWRLMAQKRGHFKIYNSERHKGKNVRVVATFSLTKYIDVFSLFMTPSSYSKLRTCWSWQFFWNWLIVSREIAQSINFILLLLDENIKRQLWAEEDEADEKGRKGWRKTYCFFKFPWNSFKFLKYWVIVKYCFGVFSSDN